ncbi:putative kinesin, partial [Trypanosoma cruzi]
GKSLEVVCETDSDCEAWLVALKRLLHLKTPVERLLEERRGTSRDARAQPSDNDVEMRWGGPIDIRNMEDLFCWPPMQQLFAARSHFASPLPSGVTGAGGKVSKEHNNRLWCPSLLGPGSLLLWLTLRLIVRKACRSSSVLMPWDLLVFFSLFFPWLFVVSLCALLDVLRRLVGERLTASQSCVKRTFEPHVFGLLASEGKKKGNDGHHQYYCCCCFFSLLLA